MTYHADGSIGGKSLLQSLDHRVGEVERHGLELRMDQPRECQEAAVAASQIENPGHSRPKEFEQRRLALGSMRNRVRLRQVRQRVLRQLPEVAVLRVYKRHR